MWLVFILSLGDGGVLLSIEGVPINACWASDFLIGFFLDEEPWQERISISQVVKMLIDIDGRYAWIRSHIKQGLIPFEGSTIGEVLNTNEERPVGPGNWQKVLREFFTDRVSRRISRREEGDPHAIRFLEYRKKRALPHCPVNQG